MVLLVRLGLALDFADVRLVVTLVVFFFLVFAVTVSGFLVLMVLAGILNATELQDVQRATFPVGLTFSMRAWGPGLGKDAVEGHKVIFMDTDTESQSQIDEWITDGHLLVCYFSGGTWEPFRDVANDFFNSGDNSELVGNKMDGWDEQWLDIRQLERLKPLIQTYMDNFKEAGCHAVEPDNIDCHDNNACYDSDFPLGNASQSDMHEAQLAYNTWMAEYAHSLGMGIAFKNNLSQVEDFVDLYDLAINEECSQWSECEDLAPFIDADKAVFGTEYSGGSGVCSDGEAVGIMMKYKFGNSWNNCFEGTDPLSATEYTGGETGLFNPSRAGNGNRTPGIFRFVTAEGTLLFGFHENDMEEASLFTVNGMLIRRSSLYNGEETYFSF